MLLQTSQVKLFYIPAPTSSSEEFGFLCDATQTFAVPAAAYCRVSLLGGLISVCHHVQAQTWSQPGSSSRTWRQNQSSSLLHPDVLRMIVRYDAVQNVCHCPDVDKVSLSFGSGWTCYC